MGRAIAVRTGYTSGEVRRVAQQVKNAAQARRLLSIAAVLDGLAGSRGNVRRNGPSDAAGLGDPVQRENRQQSYPRRARDRPAGSSRVAWRQGSQGLQQPLADAAAAARTRTQRP